MSYFTQAELVAFIPDTFQTEGLDDAGTGTADAFAAVQTEACGEIDGVLGSRYPVPFNTTDLPGLKAFLRSLSLQIAREIIFERRGRELSKSQVTRIERARTRLNSIAAGDDPLSPGLEPTETAAVIIGEDSRVYSTQNAF